MAIVVTRPDRVAPGNRWCRAAAGLVVVAILAAAAAVDPSGARPFTTLRWPLVAASVLGAGALVWSHRARIPRSVAAGGLGLLGWLVVATVAGEDGLIGWIGHPRRHFGLLAVVVCAVALVVGASLDGRGRRILGLAACAGSGLLGLGALSELVGLDIAGASFPGPRTGGLLGQPAYLAALGVLLVPVAVAVAATATSRLGRWTAWSTVALGVTAVVTSQTRGAWLGLLVAVVLGWSSLRGRVASAALGLAAVVFALAVLVAALPLGPQLLASFDDQHSSTTGRLDEWRVAAQVVADHPVLGVGPEGYRLVATEHLDAAYSDRYGREVVVDRAHNGVLDIAVIGGIPAGVLYVALLGLVAVRLWRARRGSALVAGAAIGSLAYGVQQLVLFPLAEIDPLAWLLVGMALVPTGDSSSAGSTSPSPSGSIRSERRGRWSVAVGVVLGVLAVATVVAGAFDVASDREMAAAGDALAAGRPRDALAAADRATTWRPDSIDAWYLAARVAVAGDSLVDVDIALDRVESGLWWSPTDPALLDLREQLLVERALRSGSAIDVQLAHAAIDDRIDRDPANELHPSMREQLDRAGLTEPRAESGSADGSGIR